MRILCDAARPSALIRNSQQPGHPRLRHLRLVFYPPSSPFWSFLLVVGADQLSVLWPIILASFTVYQVRLGSELTRVKSLLSIFVTRRRSPTAATLNLEFSSAQATECSQNLTEFCSAPQGRSSLTLPIWTDPTVRYCGIGVTRTALLPAARESPFPAQF